MIPPSRMTFEQAVQLQRELRAYRATVDFDGYTGNILVQSVPPFHHEALQTLDGFGAILTDIRCGSLKSFTEYFGQRASMDRERAAVYCQMCSGKRADASGMKHVLRALRLITSRTLTCPPRQHHEDRGHI